MDTPIVKLPPVITHQQTEKLRKKFKALFDKKQFSPSVEFDFQEVEQMDSAGAIFIQNLRSDLEKNNVEVLWTNLSPAIERTLKLFKRPLPPVFKSEKKNFFEKIGETGYNLSKYFAESILLFSNIGYWSFLGFFRPGLRRKGDVVNQGVLIGVNALPIVALIAFLIGFILALQSAAQLRQFGANIYVADLIAIAMVSEMGPLITAILVAGRSGSAITAEIATMKVSEEIDALTVMGVDPVPYLIVPKLYAIIITLPLLTVFANIIGITGGAVIGVTYLDINFVAFFKEVFTVLRYKEIFTGLIKSLSFSIIILLTATYFGFRVKGGAEGVGRVTTASVVASIFFVIVADSILGLIFYFGESAF